MALIAIEHPDVETPASGPALVSERAYESIWQHKGWTKVEGSEQEAPAELVLPDGSLDKQIKAAQAALEAGKLKPPAEGTPGDTPGDTAGVDPARTPARRRAAGTGSEES